MRCSSRRNTGRSSRDDFRSRKPRSASRRVLVAEGGVFGADVRVGGGDEVLAVQPLLCLDLGAIDDQPPAGLLTQPAAERRKMVPVPPWAVAVLAA